MKEIGILFKDEMVRAILEDRKTQTRRIPTYMNTLVDGQSVGKKVWESFGFNFMEAYVDSGPSPAGNPGPYFHVPSRTRETVHRLYPKWEIGDLLWVKEFWGYKRQFYELHAEDGGEIIYRVDGDPDGCHGDPWRSSLFMPRKISRIDLHVTGIRAQMIQEITEEDAKKEGAMPCKEYDHLVHAGKESYRCTFVSLWQYINADRGYGWETNWPVWVFDFKRKGGEQ